MKMGLVLALASIINVVIPAVTGQYTTSKNGTWQGVNEICRLASPRLRLSEEGAVLVQNPNIFSLLQEGDEAWIGYATEFINVKLKGCVKDDGLPAVAIDNPDNCAYVCRHTTPSVFGLRKQEDKTDCLCFNSTIYIGKELGDDCNTNCYDSELLCGSDSSVAVYEEVSSRDSFRGAQYRHWNDADRHCLAYNKLLYSWEPCSMTYRPICSSNYDASIGFPSEDSSEWHIAASNCLAEEKFILSHSSNITIEGETEPNEQLWTANARLMVITKLHETNKKNASKFREYGYVYKSRDSIYLRFTDSMVTNRRAICRHEKRNTIAPVVSSSTSVPVTYNNRSTSSKQNTVTLTVSSSTSVPVTSYKRGTSSSLVSLSTDKASTDFPSPRSSDYSLVAVYIGVPITVVSLIVLLWFISRRLLKKKHQRNSNKLNDEAIPGRNHFGEPKEHHNVNIDYHDIDIDNTAKTAHDLPVVPIQDNFASETGEDPEYTYVTDEETDVTRTYFVLEKSKHSNEGDIEMTNIRSSEGESVELHMYDRTMRNKDDDCYDKLVQKSKFGSDKCQNTYDSVATGSASHVYDTTQGRNRTVRAIADDSVYSKVKNDIYNQTYDTTTAGQNMSSNDTYDHI